MAAQRSIMACLVSEKDFYVKRSPEKKRLEEVLRSSRIVAGGFLGSDTRILEEILEADAAEVSQLGTTMEDIAARMRAFTHKESGQPIGCGIETPLQPPCHSSRFPWDGTNKVLLGEKWWICNALHCLIAAPQSIGIAIISQRPTDRT